jgi:hypothetical protein
MLARLARRGSPKSKSRPSCIPVSARLGPELTEQSEGHHHISALQSSRRRCCSFHPYRMSHPPAISLLQGVSPHPSTRQQRFRSYIALAPRKLRDEACIDRCRHPWWLLNLVSAPNGELPSLRLASTSTPLSSHHGFTETLVKSV